MGEAKRRQQAMLKKANAVPEKATKISLNEVALHLIKEEFDSPESLFWWGRLERLIAEIPVESFVKNQNVIHSAILQKFFPELAALQSRVDLKWEASPFALGRLALFDAIYFGFKVSVWDDLTHDSYKKKIHKAGKMLWKSGGMTDMHDLLVWSFIPRPIHREIDLFWDGIGDWRS